MIPESNKVSLPPGDLALPLQFVEIFKENVYPESLKLRQGRHGVSVPQHQGHATDTKPSKGPLGFWVALLANDATFGLIEEWDRI